jgi:ABC-type sugar transport system permease subunit
MKFIGLGNFAELLRDDLYWSTLFTTMKVLFIGGAMIFALSFLLTFFLSSGIRGKKFFRAVIFYPNVVAPIALATFWGFLYNPRFGLINGLLRSIGLESWTQVWTGPDLIFGAVLVSLVWTYIGFYLVIMLSAVERIPIDYYDAARLDGAGKIQIFFTVTIPLVWDVLVINAVLWVITAVKLFDFLYAFSGGIAAPRELWTNAVYMFILTFGKRMAIFRLGYGTAVAVTLLVIIIIFTSVVRLAMRRDKVEY